jgi:hypothetical protein
MSEYYLKTGHDCHINCVTDVDALRKKTPTSAPPYVFMAWDLVTYRDKFIFTLPLPPSVAHPNIIRAIKSRRMRLVWHVARI